MVAPERLVEQDVAQPLTERGTQAVEPAHRNPGALRGGGELIAVRRDAGAVRHCQIIAIDHQAHGYGRPGTRS